MQQMRSDVLFISLTLMLTQCVAQSPCPQYFEYKNDDTGIYGIVHLYPTESVTVITVRVNFTIAAQLPSSYLGKLEPLGEDLALIEQFNRGSPIDVRMNFPVVSPLPKITAIVLNNDLLCSGPPDKPITTYVTRISLAHSLFLKNGGRPASHPHTFSPPRPEKPHQDPYYTDSSPYFLINNTPIGISGLDNGRPTFVFIPTSKDPNQYTNVWQTTRPPSTRPPSTRPDVIYRLPSPPPQPITTTTTTTTTRRPQESPRPSGDECGINGNIDNVPLIYNGMSYNRGEWPWLVALFKRKDIGISYICSGTLISNLHVLTAAHCMLRKTSLTSINDIIVKAGVFDILDWGDDDVTVTRSLAAATIHESYNATTLANDILILTFTRPVEFNSYIRPACLWSGNTDLALIVGASGVVTGWGVSEIAPAGKGEPRMVRMPVVSTTACRASKPEFHKLTSSKTLCAGDRNGAGPCLGDSGGGLYMKDNGRWRVRGIVSVSLKSPSGDLSCNLDDYIVFTDAAQYLPWISSTMKTNQ